MRETWEKQQVSEGKLEDTTQRLDKESRTKEALKKELRALEETLFQVFCSLIFHFFCAETAHFVLSTTEKMKAM